MPDASGGVPPRTCHDGGTCHHGCADGPCFRVLTCGPLSGVYPEDRWPVEVLAKTQQQATGGRSSLGSAGALRTVDDLLALPVGARFVDRHGDVGEIVAPGVVRYPETADLTVQYAARYLPGAVVPEPGTSGESTGLPSVPEPSATPHAGQLPALLALFADDLEDVRVNHGGVIGTQMVARARALARVAAQVADAPGAPERWEDSEAIEKFIEWANGTPAVTWRGANGVKDRWRQRAAR